MKKFWCVLLSLAALLSFTSLAAYAAEPEEAELIPAQWTEVYDGPFSPEEEELLDELEGVRKTDRFILTPLPGTTAETLTAVGETAVTAWESFGVAAGQPEKYVAVTLAKEVRPERYMEKVEGAVAFIQPDHQLEILAGEATQAGIPAAQQAWLTELEELWTVSRGEGVTVALLDAGIDLSHPSLEGHFTDGWNFTDASPNVTAEGTSIPQIHGTHIAGLISAVAPETTLLPVQVFEDGLAYTSDLVAAIRYAQMSGAQIVNCSWGGWDDNPVLKEAIQASDMLFVAAAGNNNNDLSRYPIYPAGFGLDNVVVVGATDFENTHAFFSNYGEGIDVNAPGLQVVSAVPGMGYGEMSGTSVSAGFVSGVAALTLANGDGQTKEGFLTALARCSERLEDNAALAALPAMEAAALTAQNGTANKPYDGSFYDKKVTQISTDTTFTAVLREDGSVWAWGDNSRGQCGIYGSEEDPTPVPVGGLNNIKKVIACHSCGYAIRNDGAVMVWGGEMHPELGLAQYVSKPVPALVEGLPPIQDGFPLGYTDACILKENDYSFWAVTNVVKEEQITHAVFPQPMKKVYYDHDYQEYIGLTTAGAVATYALDGTLKKEMTNLPQITDIACDGFSCIALDVNGVPWAYGDNRVGQLSPQSKNHPYRTFGRMGPAEGELLADVKAVYAGDYTLYAICADDTITAFGTAGGRGWPTATEPEAPLYKIKGLENTGLLRPVTMISAGHSARIAVLQDGTVVSWGSNAYGGMGVPLEIKSRRYPIKVGVPQKLEIVHMDNALISGVSCFTPISQLDFPPTCRVELETREYLDLPVAWDPDTAGDYNYLSRYVLGTWDPLPEGITNGRGFVPRCKIQQVAEELPYIGEMGPIAVIQGTPADQLPLPESVTLELDYYPEPQVLPITWNTAGYDPNAAGEQVLNGKVTPPWGYVCPPGNQPFITVNIVPTTATICSKIFPREISVGQNILLGPTDREHAFGSPTAEELPQTVEVLLSTGERVELPVEWVIANYDPTAVGTHTYEGHVLIPADSHVTNPVSLKAKLKIHTLPKRYEVWEADPMERTLEVPVGTPLSQLSQALKDEGLSQLDIYGVDLETELDVYLFCEITIPEEGNSHYRADTPGEYTLTAGLPENFTPYDEDLPGPILVHVKTAQWAIASLEPARMDAYQSLSAPYLTDIPTQVKATLENGKELLLEAQWDWSNYEGMKDTAGEHILPGTLMDLPPYVVQPEGDPRLPVLLVNVLPVSYEVTGVLSDGDVLEGDAGLTLAELTAALSPQLTLEITSVSPGIDLVAEYVVNVALEQEKNPNFDPEYADLYILEGTLLLPGNITCPTGQGYEEILLQTNPVEVLSVESVYALADEGVPFTDLPDLPTQVWATLSCVGADGEHKRIPVTADWGSGEGYDPFPEDLTDDNSVTMTITGTLDDYPQYVNGAEVEATLVITMTRFFTLQSVSPVRIPTVGTMAVDLGSSLEKIDAQLADHSVELTLQSPNGTVSTVTLTFSLREEDNPDYDPMRKEEAELHAYLPVGEKIRNPQNLGLTIAVLPTQYSITSIKATRLTEPVESGTPFAALSLPGEVTVVRSGDKKQEPVSATWREDTYNPTKLGSQIVRGTLVTPLPVHLTNPNNRQPNAAVTVVSSTARILSMEQLPRDMMLLSLEEEAEEPVEELLPGYTEYRYLAQVLHGDGTVTEEIISVFVEAE